MINSFDFYLKQGKVKTKTPDPEEAKALLQKAEERMQYIDIKKITTITAKFVLEDSYEDARDSINFANSFVKKIKNCFKEL